MQPICLPDKTEIERFLWQNVPLHLDQLGDLDDFFGRYSRQYGVAAINNVTTYQQWGFQPAATYGEYALS